MACNLTSGWLQDCKDSLGGLFKLYILKDRVASFTEVDGIVTALNVVDTPDPVAVDPETDWFEFELPKQSSTFNESPTVSVENGTVFYEQSAVLAFNKLDAQKRNQIKLMAQNNFLLVVVLDSNGKYWTVGLEFGATLTEAALSSGTAYGDRNGGELTITGYEPQPSFEVDADLMP